MRRFRVGMRAALLGVVINAVLAVVKLLAGIFGQSTALVADAVESMADFLSSAIAWGGLAVSRIPPDAEHPYGHGKAEPLAAAAIAILILIAALGIAMDAALEIARPHEPPARFTLWVLVGVIVVKEGLARHLFRVGDRISSLSIRGDAWHQRSDAITSGAAFVGIGIALLGGESWQAADEAAALLSALVIAAGGVRLLRPAVDELMDKEPAGDLRQRSVEVAKAQEGVEAVEKNWLRKVGPSYFFDLHIEVRPDLTVDAAHHIAHRVSDAVRAAFPQIAVVTVHVEPHDK